MLEKITYNGKEGYFLPLEKKEQIETTINHCSEVFKKVIQNADNS